MGLLSRTESIEDLKARLATTINVEQRPKVLAAKRAVEQQREKAENCVRTCRATEQRRIEAEREIGRRAAEGEAVNTEALEQADRAVRVQQQAVGFAREALESAEGALAGVVNSEREAAFEELRAMLPGAVKSTRAALLAAAVENGRILAIQAAMSDLLGGYDRRTCRQTDVHFRNFVSAESVEIWSQFVECNLQS